MATAGGVGRAGGGPRGMSAAPATRLYANAELGVRFEIDASFVDGPPGGPAPALPDNVVAAYLTADSADGPRAVLSICRVEAGYETSPQELAEQLVIHNRFAAHTATRNGSTIHSPWKATMLAGYPAMHCDYVVPGAGGGPASLAVPAGGPAPLGHVQAWVVYAGPRTFQVMLAVDPPGDLAGNRATAETVVHSFEIGAPGGDVAGADRA